MTNPTVGPSDTGRARLREALELIANGEWVTDSSAQELARAALAAEPPASEGRGDESLSELLEDRAAWRKRAEEAEEGLAKRIFCAWEGGRK